MDPTVRGCWKTIFGVTLQVLWLNRNEFTFRSNRVACVAVGRKILCIVAAIQQCYGDQPHARSRMITPNKENIRWKAPPSWIYEIEL